MYIAFMTDSCAIPYSSNLNWNWNFSAIYNSSDFYLLCADSTNVPSYLHLLWKLIRVYKLGYAKFALIRVYKDTQSFPQAKVVADEELLLDLHLLSVNVAQVMLIAWLSEMESTCIKEETPYEQVWCLHSFDLVVNSLWSLVKLFSFVLPSAMKAIEVKMCNRFLLLSNDSVIQFLLLVLVVNISIMFEKHLNICAFSYLDYILVEKFIYPFSFSNRFIIYLSTLEAWTQNSEL